RSAASGAGGDWTQPASKANSKSRVLYAKWSSLGLACINRTAGPRSTGRIALAGAGVARHSPCIGSLCAAPRPAHQQENSDMQDFQNKVAVITGGGSGLGRELALCCAARGMKLVLGDVDEAGMQETLRLVEAAHPGTEAVTMRLDVSRLEQVEELAALSKSCFGGAHLVFNNAGVSVNGPIWKNTVHDWEWVLGVNLYGVVWGIKAFTPM